MTRAGMSRCTTSSRTARFLAYTSQDALAKHAASAILT
jgi:hypothetical protein